MNGELIHVSQCKDVGMSLLVWHCLKTTVWHPRPAIPFSAQETHCLSIWLLADGFCDQLLSLLCKVRQTPQYHPLMPTVPKAGEGRASHVHYCVRHSQSSFCR